MENKILMLRVQNHIKKINNVLKRRHNPKLVKPEQPPKMNTIYKLHEDGHISREAGGWVYGNRTPIIEKEAIVGAPISLLKFPIGGAILTLEECLDTRRLMYEYLNPKTYRPV
jgi:hypothetical protein